LIFIDLVGILFYTLFLLLQFEKVLLKAAFFSYPRIPLQVQRMLKNPKHLNLGKPGGRLQEALARLKGTA